VFVRAPILRPFFIIRKTDPISKILANPSQLVVVELVLGVPSNILFLQTVAQTREHKVETIMETNSVVRVGHVELA